MNANFFIDSTSSRADPHARTHTPGSTLMAAGERLMSRRKSLRHDPSRRGILRLTFNAHFDKAVVNSFKPFCSPGDVRDGLLQPATSNLSTLFLFPLSNIRRKRFGRVARRFRNCFKSSSFKRARFFRRRKIARREVRLLPQATCNNSKAESRTRELNRTHATEEELVDNR